MNRIRRFESFGTNDYYVEVDGYSELYNPTGEDQPQRLFRPTEIAQIKAAFADRKYTIYNPDAIFLQIIIENRARIILSVNEQDYYLVEYSDENGSDFFYRCDQLEGLQCWLDDYKNNLL